MGQQLTKKIKQNGERKYLTTYIGLALAAVLIAIDQGLKYLVVLHLKPRKSSVELIPGLLQLTYVENTGAAFGLFRNQRWLLAVVVSLIVIGYLYVLLSGKIQSSFVIIVSCLILAGGVGNLIDRIARGYVVDFLDIGPLFAFPVFNFADCLVVVGCILLLIYFLFIADHDTPQNDGSPTIEEGEPLEK